MLVLVVTCTCALAYISNYTCRCSSARDQDQSKNVEDVLFDMFKNEETGLLPVGKFLAVSSMQDLC